MSHCGPLLICKSGQPPLPAGQLASTVVRIGCPLVTEHIYTKEEMEIRTLTPKKRFLFSFFELWKWTWWVECQAQGKGKGRRFRPENVSRSSSPCPLCICQLFFHFLFKSCSHIAISQGKNEVVRMMGEMGESRHGPFPPLTCVKCLYQLWLLSQVSGSKDQTHRLSNFGKFLTSESPFLHHTQGHHENERQSIQNPWTTVDAQ